MKRSVKRHAVTQPPDASYRNSPEFPKPATESAAESLEPAAIEQPVTESGEAQREWEKAQQEYDRAAQLALEKQRVGAKTRFDIVEQIKQGGYYVELERQENEHRARGDKHRARYYYLMEHPAATKTNPRKKARPRRSTIEAQRRAKLAQTQPELTLRRYL